MIPTVEAASVIKCDKTCCQPVLLLGNGNNYVVTLHIPLQSMYQKAQYGLPVEENDAFMELNASCAFLKLRESARLSEKFVYDICWVCFFSHDCIVTCCCNIFLKHSINIDNSSKF